MKTIPLIIKLVVMVIVLSVSTSCKSYMKYKYGITQPQEETPEKLIGFLEKNHFPQVNQYMFSDSAAYSQSMRDPEFSKHLLSHMIFDRQGILIQRDTTQCQWSGYEKLKSLSIDSIYLKGDGLQLNQILSYIRPFGKDELPLGSFQDPDFTVIVTWAKFIGKYNYRLFALADAPNLNKTARIRMIWLNVDMQESWQLTRDQKVAIK